MQQRKQATGAAETLLEIDSKARETFAPHRREKPVRALAWVSEAGDQMQMRLIAGGTLAAGLVRSDVRMVRAGARMLLAHELATFAKGLIKDRVDRTRPRSASDEEDEKPRAGHDHSKEESSFPSGHSAGALAVARAFAAEYPEHRGKALAGAAVVALAQIPRAAHYPTDVAAGLAIGAAAEAVVGFVWRAAASMLRDPARRAASRRKGA